MPWDHDHQKHHDRRRLDRVVGADKVNPATAAGLLLYRSDNEREAVATHDSDI
jgi:hypothetical protein